MQAFLGSRSEDTFRGLFKALYPKLVSYFAVRDLDLQVAEELAQDVLMTTYQHADSLRQKECFFEWRFRVAGNRHGRRDEEGRLRDRVLQVRQRRAHLPDQSGSVEPPSLPARSGRGGLFCVWPRILALSRRPWPKHQVRPARANVGQTWRNGGQPSRLVGPATRSPGPKSNGHGQPASALL